MFKLALLNVKNIVRSKAFIYSIIAAVAYSLLWLIVGQTRKFTLEFYSIEFGRFLYVVILYVGVSIIRNDIIFNTTKSLFTGIYTRIEIMISKLVALVILGVIFSLIVELDALLLAILDPKKIGIGAFLNLPHFQSLLTYIVITFSIGSFMFLISSMIFNGGKSILFAILFLSAINFNNAFIVTLASRDIEFAKKISLYAKTPFYIWTDLYLNLRLESLNIRGLLIAVGYGLIFSVYAIFIMNRREIK
jgi:hypothetical protein